MKKAVLTAVIAMLVFCAAMIGYFAARTLFYAPVISTRYPQSSQTPTEDPNSSTQPAYYLVNINTATAEQLQQLPGIGPVTADRIIAWREENGPFETVSQLTLVDGIGIHTLENILDYITTGG